MSRELDADVAEKVMGVEPCDRHGTYGECGHGMFGKEYSTDIDAAWGVVDHLVAQDAYVLVEGPANGLIHNGWRCAITPRRDLSAQVEAWGDTVMLAICRAALAAVGQAVGR